jgi:hypothetical protein
VESRIPPHDLGNWIVGGSMRQSNTTESVRSYLILLSTAHVDCSRSRRIDYPSRAREQCQAIGKVQRKPRPASVLLASPKCPTDVGEGRTGLMCRVRGPCVRVAT